MNYRYDWPLTSLTRDDLLSIDELFERKTFKCLIELDHSKNKFKCYPREKFESLYQLSKSYNEHVVRYVANGRIKEDYVRNFCFELLPEDSNAFDNYRYAGQHIDFYWKQIEINMNTNQLKENQLRIE